MHRAARGALPILLLAAAASAGSNSFPSPKPTAKLLVSQPCTCTNWVCTCPDHNTYTLSGMAAPSGSNYFVQDQVLLLNERSGWGAQEQDFYYNVAAPIDMTAPADPGASKEPIAQCTDAAVSQPMTAYISWGAQPDACTSNGAFQKDSGVSLSQDPNKGAINMTYVNGGSCASLGPDGKRKVTILVGCDAATTGKPTYVSGSIKEIFTCHVELQLKHAAACPGGGAASGPAPAPGPAPGPAEAAGGPCANSVCGWAFFGAVLGLTFFYVCIGCWWNRRQDRAGMEACPNYEFWKDLPGLIKDGCRCVLSCGRGNGYGSM